MTKCAADFAKPNLLGGHQNLDKLVECLHKAKITFNNTRRFNDGTNGGNGPTCMECWTDNIMCDASQCSTNPSCIKNSLTRATMEPSKDASSAMRRTAGPNSSNVPEQTAEAAGSSPTLRGSVSKFAPLACTSIAPSATSTVPREMQLARQNVTKRPCATGWIKPTTRRVTKQDSSEDASLSLSPLLEVRAGVCTY